MTIWVHLPTKTHAEFVGEDRTISGSPAAIMKLNDGTHARIDPIDLVNGNWKLLDNESSIS